eukprot:9487124-Pyramimonas_sp.AAC.2
MRAQRKHPPRQSTTTPAEIENCSGQPLDGLRRQYSSPGVRRRSPRREHSPGQLKTSRGFGRGPR